MDKDPNQTAFLLKTLMDTMSDMIYFKDRDSRFIMLNQATAKWQGGRSPDEIIGTTDSDFYSEEDAKRMREDELRIMETKEPLYGLEEGETRKDGTHAWVSTTKMPLCDDAGNVIGIFGISRDITEHKDAEIRAEKLAHENRLFREEIEDDLLMAAQLQKTFFPTAYPFFPSPGNPNESLVEFSHLHHSGNLIGGDLCSIRKLSDNETGIFLCDVMGHGVRAALGTSIVRAMVEEISHQKKDPGAFLSHMNDALMPFFRQEDLFMYATACYMVLNVKTGELRMASAGHPMPICLCTGQGCDHGLLERAFISGPGLAIHPHTVYETATCHLKPGETVFMFTDGLIEAFNERQEEYGVKRLRATAIRHKELPLPDLFDALHQGACDFSLEGAIEDDVCIVGFRLMDQE
jgi:phosphoserine phosphatase RsbU/P